MPDMDDIFDAADDEGAQAAHALKLIEEQALAACKRAAAQWTAAEKTAVAFCLGVSVRALEV